MTKRILYHTCFWLAYTLFKTYLNYIADELPQGSNPLFNTFFTMFAAQFALILVKLPLVYILFGIADRFFAKTWSLWRSGTSIAALFIAGSLVFIIINHFIVLEHIYGLPGSSRSWFSFSSMLYAFFILSFVAGLAMAIKLVRLNMRQKEAAQEMIKKKLETELRFLKSQTNPHFLFNTLNNIYALARKKSDDTAEAVLKLSKLLRFMLYESANKTIPIADELKVIDSYIELERIRYNERLEISFQQQIDDPAQPIAPLILLPFVENAFKHGASETRFSSFIHIEIRLNKGYLYFMVENSQASQDKEISKGEKIGLQNVSRQLELMYPGHTLEIENEATRFSIQLNINLLSHASL